MLNTILAALDNSESCFEFTPEVLCTLTGADLDTLLTAMRERKFSPSWCQGLVSDWRKAVEGRLIVPIPDNADQGAELAILSRQDRRYEGE
ncbi:MAG: hypothetical protein A2Y38_06570 [Spirochaetes bacterium GWB1_59_5]|nr:MAG: hypothetical protein A2Y38_06570 [Spirochaetes bacterium GWB1_59_5]